MYQLLKLIPSTVCLSVLTIFMQLATANEPAKETSPAWGINISEVQNDQNYQKLSAQEYIHQQNFKIANDEFKKVLVFNSNNLMSKVYYFKTTQPENLDSNCDKIYENLQSLYAQESHKKIIEHQPGDEAVKSYHYVWLSPQKSTIELTCVSRKPPEQAYIAISLFPKWKTLTCKVDLEGLQASSSLNTQSFYVDEWNNEVRIIENKIVTFPIPAKITPKEVNFPLKEGTQININKSNYKYTIVYDDGKGHTHVFLGTCKSDEQQPVP